VALQETFLGSGAIIGVLPAMTGSSLPGHWEVVAQGNTLGKGPTIFCLPQRAVEDIKQRAAAGDATMAALRLELFRLAGLFVVETAEEEMREEVARHAEVAVRAGARLTGTMISGLSRGPSVAARLTGLGNHSLLRKTMAVGDGSGGLAGGQRAAGAGGSGVVMGSGGAGTGLPLTLTPSKSLGANLAKMMEQIAAMEFDDDDDGEEKKGAPAKKRAGVRSGSPTRSLLDGESSVFLPPSPSLFSKSTTGIDDDDAHDLRKRLAQAARAARKIAAEVAQEMRRGLGSALLIELDPGTDFEQTSHMLLLRGQVVDGKRLGVPPVMAPRPLPSRSAIQQRCTLVSGGSPASLAVGQLANPVGWAAGVEGATLLVWLDPGGKVPKAVVGWQEEERRRTEKSLAASQRASGNGERGHSRRLNGGRWSISGVHGSTGDLGSFPVQSASREGSGHGRVAFATGGGSASGSEQGSMMGAAAAAMGRELSSLIGKLRRSETEPRR
jgi:hypothetical protein